MRRHQSGRCRGTRLLRPTSRSRCRAAPADNATFSVKINWGTANSDYDLYDLQGRQRRRPARRCGGGSSAAGSTNSEVTSFGEPDEKVAGKRFIARVVNFAGTEPSVARSPTRDPSRPRVTGEGELRVHLRGDRRPGRREHHAADRPCPAQDRGLRQELCAHGVRGPDQAAALLRLHQGWRQGHGRRRRTAGAQTHQAAQDAPGHAAVRPQGHRPLLPEEGRRLAAGRIPDQPPGVEALEEDAQADQEQGHLPGHHVEGLLACPSSRSARRPRRCASG